MSAQEPKRQFRLSTLFVLTLVVACGFGFARFSHPAILFCCFLVIFAGLFVAIVEGVYWLDYRAPPLVRKTVNLVICVLIVGLFWLIFASG